MPSPVDPTHPPTPAIDTDACETADADAPDAATRPSADATELANATVDRTWQLRREAEKQPGWQLLAGGLLAASGFTLIAGAQFLPGGAGVALAVIGLLVVVMLAVVGFNVQRTSHRGHSGTVTPLPGVDRPWWRNPAAAGPAAFAVVFVGGITEVFDHLPFVLACGILLGLVFAKWLPRYETADPVTGPDLENAPALTAGAVRSVESGELTPDVMELLVLQHHTGERRVAWCAKVLDTTSEDIRERTRRGSNWLDLPATEAHRPTEAAWIRLSTEGREALGYI